MTNPLPRLLAGLSLLNNSQITSADSIITAFGKLQAQISNPAVPPAIPANGSETINLNPGGADTNNIVMTDKVLTKLVGTGANQKVTGLSAPVPNSTRYRILLNSGTFDISLRDNDANSLAANRFLVSGNFLLQAGKGIWILYDEIVTRWRIVG